MRKPIFTTFMLVAALALGAVSTHAGFFPLQLLSLKILGETPSRAAVLKISRSRTSSVSLEWTGPCKKFSISRSYFKGGPYQKLADVDDHSFRDTSAESGWKYWYKVQPSASCGSAPVLIESGYIAPPDPQGLKPDFITKLRTKPRPAPPADKEARDLQNLHMRLMNYFHDGYIMTSFIYLAGKVYVDRGDLVIYRDFRHYVIDRQNKVLYLSKPGEIYVRFHSRRFFRFIKYNDRLKLPDSDLLDRIIKNGIAYCRRSGEKEIKMKDGRIRMCPHFDAAGFSTEYFRDFKDWKSNTIIFGSNDKDIEQKIQEAGKKGY